MTWMQPKFHVCFKRPRYDFVHEIYWFEFPFLQGKLGKGGEHGQDGIKVFSISQKYGVCMCVYRFVRMFVIHLSSLQGSSGVKGRAGFPGTLGGQVSDCDELNPACVLNLDGSCIQVWPGVYYINQPSHIKHSLSYIALCFKQKKQFKLKKSNQMLSL